MPIHNLHLSETANLKRASKLSITSYEQAVQKHHDYQRTNRYPDNAVQVMNILATAGVLTTAQLQSIATAAPRTLRDYQRSAFVLSAAYPPKLQNKPLKSAKRNRLWTLGLVGIARAVDLQQAAKTFRGYPYKKTVHDILLNEIVVELLSQAAAEAVPHTWYGTYEGRVRDGKNNVLVEPDALLLFGQDDQKKGFAIEYHNEDDRRRVGDKIDRYEGVQRSAHWRRFWDVAEMPTVVVAVTHPIVLEGYIDTIAERGHAEIRCQYVGKSFGRFAENRAEATVWTNLNKIAFENKREPVRLF
ncbi:MAG TPA: hypothetical protein ENJ56_04265 [Anaerolineae bacterium]|nr:hypothetical protein [Anaerolineae bacterium]